MTEVRAVLLTGSRTWTRAALLWARLDAEWDACVDRGDLMLLVHGHCPNGADNLADGWAIAKHVPVLRWPASWATGPRAGFRRNAEMVIYVAEYRSRLCLAALRRCEQLRCRDKVPHETHGGAHCAGLADRHGIPVERLPWDAPSSA
jgi:hypothetical protein